MASATPTVFVTGVTGLVGGDSLQVIYATHPDWKYRFLVRTAEKGALVKAAFPNNSTLVTGSLETLDILKSEAQNADIVLHFASSDDLPAMEALLAGTAARPADKPGYLIHTSGTGMLLYDELAAGILGQRSEKFWDDVADIDALLNFPDAALHRNVEKVVLDSNLRTALVSPCNIVGEGRGPDNKRSVFMPMLTEIIRQRGQGFAIGRGLARWSTIHVRDLAQVFLLLAEDAARGGTNPEIWGRKGYFFAENGDREISKLVEQITFTLNARRPDQVPDRRLTYLENPEEIAKLGFIGQAIGANSLSRATRARTLLGWTPVYSEFDGLASAAVDIELTTPGDSRLAEISSGKGPKVPPNTFT